MSHDALTTGRASVRDVTISNARTRTDPGRSRAALALTLSMTASAIAVAGVVGDARAADAKATGAAAASRAETKPSVPAPVAAPVPAGRYTLDTAHASLVFRVSHLGFSQYTGRFTKFDADLTFDPAKLASSRVNVAVQANSLTADGAPAGFMDALHGPEWLDAKKYPTITFRSTRVEPQAGNRLKITGDFTLHGVTRPLALDATYNGGYAGHPMDPHARIGFSARGSLNRSEFGIAYGVPAPGSTFGVGDRVEVIVEAEFTGPPLAK
jgi:polyisoprenoid-binding protein YceI